MTGFLCYETNGSVCQWPGFRLQYLHVKLNLLTLVLFIVCVHFRPYIIDLDSINGTFLNNQKIDPRRFYELKEKVSVLLHGIFYLVIYRQFQALDQWGWSEKRVGDKQGLEEIGRGQCANEVFKTMLSGSPYLSLLYLILLIADPARHPPAFLSSPLTSPLTENLEQARSFIINSWSVNL